VFYKTANRLKTQKADLTNSNRTSYEQLINNEGALQITFLLRYERKTKKEL